MSDTARGDRIVIVGVDGSDGSAAALQWALEHADHLGDIEPVLTFVSGPFEYGFDTSERTDDIGLPYRSEATFRLRAFLDVHAPSLVDAGLVLEFRAGPGLVKAAEAAELLVVGTGGWSDRADLSIGSVGAYSAHHSKVPVALIPRALPASHDHLDVVVGFDGSRHAQGALRWALTHLRGSAQVLAVRAFTDESVVGEALAPLPGNAEAEALSELETGVAAVLEHLDRHPPVELAVRSGDPRAVLREAGDGADLLVVGARGHGVLDRLLLGSVASAMAHHPMVPTVVVPHHR